MQMPQHAPQSPFNVYHDAVCTYLPDSDLYQHQKEALQNLRGWFMQREHQNIALVVLPTGCGKTGVAVLAPYCLNASRVLVIAPSVVVAEQLEREFKSFLVNRGFVSQRNFNAGVRPSVVRVEQAQQFPDVYDHSNTHVVITNVQKVGSARPRVTLDDLPDGDAFDLVIVDEAHHYPARTWRRLIDHFPNSRRLFLTATDTYNDQYILGDAIGQVPPIPRCYYLPRERAIDQGIIRATRFIEVHCRDPADDPEYQAAKRIAEEVHRVLEAHDVAYPAVRHKAMVLAQTKEGVNSAHTALQAFDEVCGEGYAALYVEGSQDHILGRFTGEAGSRVLIIVGRLLEGFDHKPISVVGIFRNVARASRVLFTQFVGRCVRRCEGEAGILATVISDARFNQQPNYENLDRIVDVDPEDNVM
eukprot:m.255886 g.255886  ORF g.255886 m.255886 type:complete len:416 (+) comp20461_c0_seq1:112-1359(+)